MSRSYRARQVAYAFLLAALGLAAAVGVIVRAIDDMTTFPAGVR